MATTQHTATSARRPVAPRIDSGASTCTCGQDLDLVAGGHCPRCGTQLGSPHFEPVGFWCAA